jgi:hypothetical protein
VWKALNVLVLIASYLVIVFVLPIALTAVVRYRALPSGRRCPECRDDTIWLARPRLRALARLYSRARVQRRWCLGCGWEGITRVARPTPERATTEIAAMHSTQTLDLRSLTVDGRPWRVMLQCWHHTGLFYGRLVFIAPSGKLWLDAVESFTGATHFEVLGQALSLPDGLLTNRLRKLVGDY